MQMRSVGRAAFARALVIMVTAFAGLLPIVPARANDIPLVINTQQTMYGKTYSFCFSGISVRAGNSPLKTITPSCSGSYSNSLSITSDSPLIVTYFGPVTITCPNGKAATTKIGATGAMFSLFLITGVSQNSNTMNVVSPCAGDNFAFSFGVSAWFPMAEWVINVVAM